MMPELSLVLPMYNVEQWVEETLRSIYSQPEAARVEVIMVDDGSPDRSAAVAERFLEAQPLKNWRIIRQENKGLGGARNTGLAAARAPYVWFIDTDDLLPSNSLSTVLNKLDGDDIIVFNFRRFPQSSSEVYIYNQEILHKSGPDISRIIPIGSVWRAIYRNDFLKSNKIFFREKYLHEDGEFSMRANAWALSVSYYPDFIYLYRSNPDSITGTMGIKNFQDMLLAIDSYEHELKLRNLSAEQIECLQLGLSRIYSYIFTHASRLSKQDWKKYRKELFANRQRIRKSQTLMPAKNRLANSLFSYFPYRWFYKFCYSVL